MALRKVLKLAISIAEPFGSLVGMFYS